MKLAPLATALLLAASGAVAAPPAEQPSPAEQASASPSAATNASEDGAEPLEEGRSAAPSGRPAR
jgi:hypothetical protein